MLPISVQCTGWTFSRAANVLHIHAVSRLCTFPLMVGAPPVHIEGRRLAIIHNPRIRVLLASFQLNTRFFL